MKKLLAALSTTILLTIPTIGQASTHFSDVPSSFWAKEEITRLAEADVISGFPDGTFKPNQSVTREQAALLLGRTLKLSKTPSGSVSFLDVNKNTEAYAYLTQFVQKGVFVNSTSFRPKSPLTRAEMAKILTTSFSMKGTASLPFTDVPRGYWAETYIKQLVANNITAGTTSTTYSPGSSVTRAQLSAFIDRALGNSSAPTVSENEKFAAEVLSLVNQERSKAGLKTLQLDSAVASVATKKSEDMRDKNYFSHTSPTYGSPFDMLKQFGISYRAAGENIAAGQRTPEEVMKAWMNSPGHKANILSTNYTHLGVGVAKGGSYGIYWTQMFIQK